MDEMGFLPGSNEGKHISQPLQWLESCPHDSVVKNPPAMQETCVRSLGWVEPLEKGKATHSSILAWRIPWTVRTQLSNFHSYLRPNRLLA